MIICIKNLRIRTIIGVYDWERENKQELIINIKFEFDGSKSAISDLLEDTVNYKALKKRIMAFVENSNFKLLEKLADQLLNLILEDPKITQATVEIDKLHALKFADSVSISSSKGTRKK